MKPVRLTLICHAQTRSQQTGCFSHPEEPVLAQTPLLASAPPGTHLISAPERRARQTAAWLGAEVQLEPALADCYMGRWQGLSLKQVQREEADALAWWGGDVQATPHGGESFAALHGRVAAWLESFAAPGDWLAVTHPLVIRAALAEVLDASLGTCQAIDVLPCARIELSRTERWRLRLLPG
ncbi:histidine phosphatase family protein [uncultured Pseudomonas sp.]|uniref:histidine phosphatase family protein n=1 Tax=uncultured Pseudomonas sp. TaxID=114707 RepID=UPI0025EC3B5F|nr:histidine phosphatase family protein [uncultured Pseudomonas sp.]